MQTHVEAAHAFFLELRDRPEPGAAPVHREEVTADLGDLVEETYVRGVLAERLPVEADSIRVECRPHWAAEPLVGRIDITLTAESNGGPVRYEQQYRAGRWLRKLEHVALRLLEAGTLAEDATAYHTLVAVPNGSTPHLLPPLLQPPTIGDETLDAFGVRWLGEGSLEPDRPVLLNGRMIEEILQRTEEVGTTETGGAVLGKLIRLPAPLPGTETRIVTVLSACLGDARHVGEPGEFTFSPEALVEAVQIAELRGKGEFVLTGWHSHGWGTSCGNCNQSDTCLLPECTVVSLADYQVMESLFPSKAAVMPIAGRRLGAEGRRPVLELHAWHGGRLSPCRWQRYSD